MNIISRLTYACFSVLAVSLFLCIGCTREKPSLKDEKIVRLPIIRYSSSDETKDFTLSISEDVFKNQIKYLYENNYQTISLEELSLLFEGRIKLPPKSVLLTFDETDKSVYEKVYPILKEYGFRGSIFITTDLLGTNNMLTVKQVIELIDNGFSIGSQGASKHFLVGLREEALVREVLGSKKDLERKIGRRVDYFAYRGGNFTEEIEDLVKDSGYKGAFTSITGIKIKRDNHFELRRNLVSQDIKMDIFLRILKGDKYLHTNSWTNILRHTIKARNLSISKICIESLLEMGKRSVFLSTAVDLFNYYRGNKNSFINSIQTSFKENSSIKKIETSNLITYISNNEEIIYRDGFKNIKYNLQFKGYNGIAYLMNKEQRKNIFVSVYSGMNYEDSSLSWQTHTIKFEPRKLHMSIEEDKDGAIILHQNPSELKGLEMTIKYSSTDPNCIDQSNNFILHKKGGNKAALHLLFASYINKPSNINIYLKGKTENDTKFRWLEVTKLSHESKDYTVFDLGDNVLSIPDYLVNHKYQSSQSVVKVQWDKRYYYGFYDDFVFIMMFKDPKGIGFSYSPSGGGIGNPAWDYTFNMENYKINKVYGFETRLCYKKFISRADIENEFNKYIKDVKKD